jgi:hypothetical protein
VATVLDRLGARLRRQGLDEARMHAHLFRHDYITSKDLDGENPSVLKRWVGYRTFAMTDRYFGIAESKLAAVHPSAAFWRASYPCHKRGALNSELWTPGSKLGGPNSVLATRIGAWTAYGSAAARPLTRSRW